MRATGGGKASKPSSSSGGPGKASMTTGSMANSVNFNENVDGFEVLSEATGGATLGEDGSNAPKVLDKAFIMGETNITQMIKSLGNRTESLKTKMAMAKELLRADVELNEEGDERGAKDLPKIVNDAEEEVPKSLRELRMNNATTGRKLSFADRA